MVLTRAIQLLTSPPIHSDVSSPQGWGNILDNVWTERVKQANGGGGVLPFFDFVLGLLAYSHKRESRNKTEKILHPTKRTFPKKIFNSTKGEKHIFPESKLHHNKICWCMKGVTNAAT